MKKSVVKVGHKIKKLPVKLKTKSTHKTLKIKHHHEKAFRKRHYGLLTIAVIASLFLFAYILQYNFTVQSGIKSARNYISGVLKVQDESSVLPIQQINSTYGFNFSYNPLKYYASGVDSITGGLFIGDELSTKRAYESIKISPNQLNKTTIPTSLSINYHTGEVITDSSNTDLIGLEKKLIEDVNIKNKVIFNKKTSNILYVSGVKFSRTEWTRKVNSTVFQKQLDINFISYVGVVNDKPLTIEINTGISDDSLQSNTDEYEKIINTLIVGNNIQSFIKPDAKIAEKKAKSIHYLNTLLLTGIASAASKQQNVLTSEKVSALYSPSIVKIYNVYCMDIYIDGKLYWDDSCNGATGSGFFVNGNGNIATNGHVVNSNPKDIVIQEAVFYLANGNEKYFDILANLANTNPNDQEYVGKTFKEIIGMATEKMYALEDSRFEARNNVTNLLVNLNEKQPDINELLKVTKARKSYTEQDSIKQAKLIGSDYRAIDGLNGYKASDVAIIKIEGSNYPSVELGSISEISQGSSLNILGFPANASSNGIVDEKSSKVTLTSGKVSSIKDAHGSSKKLIETDTTIGHGNSGGPVLTDFGKVIGIATYTADGSGTGDGVFNYIRDIKDLKDLAEKSKVNYELSDTQKEWAKGIEFFYNSRYSKAVKNFDKVKKLYPQHPTVDSMLAAANERIKNGQDVKDFPLLLVAGGVGSIVIIGGGALYMILRHKKTHNIYKNQVAAGNMQPIIPGSAPQQYGYNPQQFSPLGQPLAQNAPHPTQPAVQPQVTQPIQTNPTLIQPTANGANSQNNAK